MIVPWIKEGSILPMLDDFKDEQIKEYYLPS
jgi:hypothetical protein